MRANFSLSALMPVALCLGASAYTGTDDARHIFNTIHSSMRQFGSSLNHNGMSVFLASVPADTQFYHGNGRSEPVYGMEWLAFEPEHASMFAWSFRGHPGNPPRHPPQQILKEEGQGHSNLLHYLMEGRMPEREPGWLHTYRTKHELRLLYLDGMSAGKTSNGTLDTQDYLLLLGNGPSRTFNDWERGSFLCNAAKKDWQNAIHGFLRMEAGFEIILCDFEKHLDQVLVTRTLDNRKVDVESYDVWFDYWRAIADRWHGIGGNRVKIYYEEFVTAFGRGLDLFKQDSSKPRLEDLAQKDWETLRADVNQLVAKSDYMFDSQRLDPWVDWQRIADMIVTRYASRLEYLLSEKFDGSSEALHGELELTLAPFINYDKRDLSSEVDRCTHHFLPRVHQESLASEVVEQISHDVCTGLFSALQASAPDTDQLRTATDPFETLKDLKSHLQWTVWKDCGQCGSEELCVVPVWPYGSLQDHEHPSCHNATVAFSQRGYWGGRMGPPPR